MGGAVVELSGSIAGNTYARNRYGQYVRARTTPTNPNTARQQTVRQAVADLTARWSQTVTAAQRTAWNLYGNSVTMKNRLGQDIKLTGFNQYIRTNVPIVQVGGTIVDAGPTIFELPEQDPAYATAVSEATQLVSVTFDDTFTWVYEDEGKMMVYVGSPQNAQRNFFDGPWRLAGTIDGDSSTPPTTPATIAVPFVCTEGQRIFTYCRILREDGRLSEKIRADSFCAA